MPNDTHEGHIECLYCDRWHPTKYATCFKCRTIEGRNDAGRDLRLEILIRDEFTCQYCGADAGQMHVAHLTPCAKGGTPDPWNLHVLCEECHKSKTPRAEPRHHNPRVTLMHIYLTYGWRLLDETQRNQLCKETARYGDEFDFRARVKAFRGVTEAPEPDWEAWMADYDQS